jgi:hypothetical protein
MKKFVLILAMSMVVAALFGTAEASVLLSFTSILL